MTRRTLGIRTALTLLGIIATRGAHMSQMPPEPDPIEPDPVEPEPTKEPPPPARPYEEGH